MMMAQWSRSAPCWQQLARLLPVADLAHGTQAAAGRQGYAAAAAAAANKTALIRELREKSGAPISDVKSCLEVCGWDVGEAYDALRRKGLAAAAKKASRHAADGLVGLAQRGRSAAAIVEVNSETDFVARNDMFASLVGRAAAAALDLAPATVGASHQADFEQLAALPLPPDGSGSGGGASLQHSCAEVAAVVRENIQLRRGFLLASPGGVVASYLHQPMGPGVGRIAAAVALEGADGPLDPAAAEAAAQLGRDLAMHVAGLRPSHLSREVAPPAVLAKEAALLREQAAASGKPAAVVDKMVEGRLAKWAEEACLLEQRFLLDDSRPVGAVVAAAGKQLGVPLRVAAFVRVQVGEGLDSAQQQGGGFAAEVAGMAAGTGGR